MSLIRSISARQINDSQGKATVEVALQTDGGEFTDSAPAGISVGSREAKTVSPVQAIENIKTVITPALVGKDPINQTAIDKALRDLDGTPDKSRLGANALLPVSLACARAGAAGQKIELYQWLANLSGRKINIPQPMMVMISGGEHGLNNSLAVQEFMVVGDANAGQKVWDKLKEYLERQKIAWQVGPEGGFAPSVLNDNTAIELLYRFKGALALACDVAASHRHSVVGMVNWIDMYGVISIEDPFDQDDWPVWQKFTKDFGSHLKIIGDDLFTTNPTLVKKGIADKVANAVVIKPNQIGTLSEVFEVARLARQAGWAIVVSHRSGETMDDFIADLAVGIGADYLKSGAPNKPERKVKYDRLEKIAKQLARV